MCFSFIIEPIIHMADASEALITAYDYYEPDRQSFRLYQTKCNDETWLTEGVNKGREPKIFYPLCRRAFETFKRFPVNLTSSGRADKS